MRHRSIRERAEALLQDLVVPSPLNWEAFAEAISARLERPIKVAPKQSSDGPCGWLITTAEFDLVLYEPHTSRVHQDHIIAHEFAHALWRHSPREHPGLADALGMLFPHVTARSALIALGRDGYTAEEEVEAETLAEVILERARATANEPHSVAEGEVVSRLKRTLGGGGS